jgi:prepilin-type processing-associated H-X9-DG protein/prepilin-type N-terminal cleavage/methylation domain-containing protein
MSNEWPSEAGVARTARPARAHRRSAAFTLTELLVVLGIIALLISIVLPAIVAARRHAYLLRCQVNLREIATGCLLHAHDHRGYMPLAGLLTIGDAPFAPGTMSSGLNDREQKRYTYASATGTSILYVVTPLPAAIAPYVGTRGLRYDNWNTLDQQLNNTLGVWKMFMCPMTDSSDRHQMYAGTSDTTLLGQGSMMVVRVGSSITHLWSTNSDFAINEAVFGFDYRSKYFARRLAGNLARVSRPSETMLFCDAKPAAKVDPALLPIFPYPWITMSPALDATEPPITLADVLAGNGKIAPYRAVLDPPRHRGRVNVVFADGHVEAVPIAPGSLQRVCLSAR